MRPLDWYFMWRIMRKWHLFSICFSFLSILILYKLLNHPKRASVTPSKDFPIAWVRGPHQETGYLSHVTEMLQSHGYQVVNYSDDEGLTRPWAILWSHQYPFGKLRPLLRRLKSHQKVNHFPGSGFITNKVSLVEISSKYIPKAFKLPAEKGKLRKYSKMNPSKKFVLKSNDHRGIRIEQFEKLNLDNDGSFVQEFIEKPLLVDGHKFDIGVYVVITSVQPLRVYMFEDILLRFCTEKYEPFDASIPEKYVVGDDYLPPWRVPSLLDSLNLGDFSAKEALNSHILNQGMDPKSIWTSIQSAIADVFYQHESKLIKSLSDYPSKSNFFELVRFDFIVDENLAVYLMEVNMSPNLSSKHFPQNALLYRRVVSATLRLVQPPLQQFMTSNELSLEKRTKSLQDITVYPQHCSSKCGGSRGSLDIVCAEDASCGLCSQCLTPEVKEDLQRTHSEHLRKGIFSRVVPPILQQERSLTPENTLLGEWFRGKCLTNSIFCS